MGLNVSSRTGTGSGQVTVDGTPDFASGTTNHPGNLQLLCSGVQPEQGEQDNGRMEGGKVSWAKELRKIVAAICQGIVNWAWQVVRGLGAIFLACSLFSMSLWSFVPPRFGNRFR